MPYAAIISCKKIRNKKSSNPEPEFIKTFDLLNRANLIRSKGAIICIKSELSAIDRENFIVPVWLI